MNSEGRASNASGNISVLKPRAGVFLSKLRGAPGGPLEAAGGGVDLSAERRKTSLEALSQSLAKDVVENPASPLDQSAADLLIAKAEDILRRLSHEGDQAAVDGGDIVAMEALIETDGSRPALFVKHGTFDRADRRLGDWAERTVFKMDDIERAIRSTGRIIKDGDLSESAVFGTAWMIAPMLAATAQHVLEAMSDRVAGTWRLRPGFKVDFSVEADGTARAEHQFAVASIERASPDIIDGKRDFRNLDVAILRLSPNETGEPPDQISLAKPSQNPPGVSLLHVVGHPARPSTDLKWLVEHGTPDPKVAILLSTLEQLLGNVFGVKRWSPGTLEMQAGELAEDVNKWIITHNATTLAGNSGAPVLDLVNFPDRAIGLHFAGVFAQQNYAHRLPAVPTLAGLQGVRFI